VEAVRGALIRVHVLPLTVARAAASAW